MPCPNYDPHVGNVSYPPSFFAGRLIRLYVPYHEMDSRFKANIQYMCKAGYRFYQLPHPIPDYNGADTDELVCHKSIPATQIANVVPRVPVSNPYEPNQDVPAAETWRLSACVKGDVKIEPDEGFAAGRITSVATNGQISHINGLHEVMPICQDGSVTMTLYTEGVGIHAVDVKEPPSAFSSRSMRLYVFLPENHNDGYRTFIQYACKAGYRIYRMPDQMPDYQGDDTDELLCGNGGSLYRERLLKPSGFSGTRLPCEPPIDSSNAVLMTGTGRKSSVTINGNTWFISGDTPEFDSAPRHVRIERKGDHCEIEIQGLRDDLVVKDRWQERVTLVH